MSFRVSTAFRAPTVVGVKEITSAQVDAAATVVHLFPEKVNSDAFVPEMVSV